MSMFSIFCALIFHDISVFNWLISLLMLFLIWGPGYSATLLVCDSPAMKQRINRPVAIMSLGHCRAVILNSRFWRLNSWPGCQVFKEISLYSYGYNNNSCS